MYELYDTEKDLEREGVWYEPNPKFRVRLARAGGANQKYNALVERLSKPHRRALEANACDPSVVNKILKTAFSRTVITGWQVNVDGEFREGIADPSDVKNTLPFTCENVMAVLEKYNDLFLDLKDIADGASAFIKIEQEADSKN